ncbi:hypothetical protein J3R83DRAFT_2471 [Lanmaoa asiatica]|nr:hypothetical protein J3R83DRAFT_2471 [Lanmaoa asiatica]
MSNLICMWQAVVLCCGAIATPQILFNSGIRPPSLGHYLSEQSIAFCQIVLKQEIVDAIWHDSRFAEAVNKHHENYPLDPLPIPFLDPEPQITLPFSDGHPWHVQIHRDAFSYGEVGPRADSRVVVDLRWFGRQEIQESNCVDFSTLVKSKDGSWKPGVTDIYGMPQPAFYVQRSHQDNVNDQMMADMTAVASILGSYLPGSNPQFMDPGLALHITVILPNLCGCYLEDAEPLLNRVQLALAQDPIKIHPSPMKTPESMATTTSGSVAMDAFLTRPPVTLRAPVFVSFINARPFALLIMWA